MLFRKRSRLVKAFLRKSWDLFAVDADRSVVDIETEVEFRAESFQVQWKHDVITECAAAGVKRLRNGEDFSNNDAVRKLQAGKVIFA